MKLNLSIVKFLTSVKIKEETNYARDVDFIIELENDLVRIQERRSKAVSFVPIHNVSYYKVKEDAVVTELPVKKKT